MRGVGGSNEGGGWVGGTSFQKKKEKLNWWAG